jgi:hypothetical protein
MTSRCALACVYVCVYACACGRLHVSLRLPRSACVVAHSRKRMGFRVGAHLLARDTAARRWGAAKRLPPAGAKAAVDEHVAASCIKGAGAGARLQACSQGWVRYRGAGPERGWGARASACTHVRVCGGAGTPPCVCAQTCSACGRVRRRRPAAARSQRRTSARPSTRRSMLSAFETPGGRVEARTLGSHPNRG